MYAGAVWAMKKWYRHDKVLHQQLADLLEDIYTTLGWQPRLVAPVAGRYIYWTMKREEKRVAAGWTIEPKTFFEKNQAALALAEVTANKGLAGPLCAPKIMQDLASHKPLPLSTSSR